MLGCNVGTSSKLHMLADRRFFAEFGKSMDEVMMICPSEHGQLTALVGVRWVAKHE